MANNIFTSQLNNRELMDAFGIQQDNTPLTPEQLVALSEEQQQAPVMEKIAEPVQAPVKTATQPTLKKAQVEQSVESSDSGISKAMDALKNWENRPKEETSSIAQTQATAQEAPMSKSEALIAEYNKLLGKGQEDLAEARRRDRMLKVGGSLGDALATYLNARSQMNVKAPGVQVQQGDGLGKIADMFATAPEIASDVAQRRQALMDQYKQLAIGESAAAKRELEKQRIQAMEEKNRLYGKQIEKMGSGREESRQFRDKAFDFKKQEADYNKVVKLQDSFNKDKQVTKAEERIQSAQTLRDMVNGNPITQEAAKTFAARASGEVGALSDQDRAAYGGTKAILSKINQIATQAASGELTEENKKFMIELADKFEQAGRRDLSARLDVYAKQGTKRVKMSEDEVKEIIRPDLVLQQQEQKSTINPQRQLSNKDQQALDWANSNPNDPRAAQIKRKLGM